MKTFLIIASLSAFTYGVNYSIGDLLPTALIGNQCSKVCSCNHGECVYSEPQAKSCMAGRRSSDCCTYCQQ